MSLDYLRAVAALLVVVGHICLLGCGDPQTVSVWVPSVTAAPYPIDGSNPYAGALIAAAVRFGLNVGHLGVALFFVLSGFVILRSLDRQSAGPFLVRRLFRILPACAAAVLFTMALLAAVCRFDGVASPLTAADGLASATLTMNVLHRLPAMPVLWSLEVEALFYLLAALLAAALGRIGSRALLGAGGGAGILVLALFRLSRSAAVGPDAAAQLVHLAQILLYMPLMLVGAVAYRRWSEGWRPGSASCVAAAAAVFAATYRAFGAVAGWDGLGVDATATALALALFAATVAWGGERRWLAPLRFVGAVSYPLYLVHAPLGWVVLAAMARCGFSVHAGCAAAASSSLLAAWALHVSVERPGQRLGAALAARFPLRPAALAAAEGLPA